jgi:Domain of unknown function (DUF4157)
MTAKVIQGFFLGGQPRLATLAQRRVTPPPIQTKTAMRSPGPPAFAARPPGPPIPAFTGRAGAVQRYGSGGAFAVEAGSLGLASGGGKALPEVVRGKMESALGADFSNVRVHVGPQAERIGAIAFTIGSDVYFAPGRYQPDTLQGQQLLGHELAHVVQQRAGRVRNPLSSGLAVVQDHALEAEADRMGQRAAAHRVAAQAEMQSAAAPATAVPISSPISAGPGSHRPPVGSHTGLVLASPFANVIASPAAARTKPTNRPVLAMPLQRRVGGTLSHGTLARKKFQPARVGANHRIASDRAQSPQSKAGVSNLLQRMPIPLAGKERDNYTKWQKIVADYNKDNGAFRFEFDKEWKNADNMPAFIAAYKARQQKAEAAKSKPVVAEKEQQLEDLEKTYAPVEPKKTHKPKKTKPQKQTETVKTSFHTPVSTTIDDVGTAANNPFIASVIANTANVTVRNIVVDGGTTYDTVYYKIHLQGPVQSEEGRTNRFRNVYTLYLHYHPKPTTGNWLHIKAHHGGTPENVVSQNNWLFNGYQNVLREGREQWEADQGETATRVL